MYNADDMEKIKVLFSGKPHAIPKDEQEWLAMTYSDLIRQLNEYDIWTTEKKEGMTEEVYLFIRSVYASKSIMIPWVDYSTLSETENGS